MQKTIVFEIMLIAAAVLFTAGCVSQPPAAPATAVPAPTITPANTTAITTAFTSLPQASLNQSEINDINELQEAEKAERDLYQTLYGRYPSTTLFNTLAVEAGKYLKADDVILQRYNLPNPELEPVGQFTTPKLQAMYNAAISQASLSVQDAVQVAALSEDLHIADLAAAISRTDNQDLTYIYQQELAFSRNNLRALIQQLTALGGTYKPTYLSQQTYDSIIGSPMEPVPV